MSYVECMECEDRLKRVSASHLKRHGLTSKEYRRRYPEARMVSDHERRQKRNRRFYRYCRKCGEPFTTGSPIAYYCRECQKVRTFLSLRKASRRYERRKRNSAKFYEAGTFNEGYLKIVNGRVRGAILLHQNISINRYGFGRIQPFNGRPPFEYEETCIMILYLMIRRTYCGECGSRLIMARETEYYTIPTEICCRSCGRVYEWDEFYGLAGEGGEGRGN